MTELRRLLGVLRFSSSDQDPSSERTVLTPAPSLSRLDELVNVMRGAGLEVSLTAGSGPLLPPGVDLTAYRIVQEALTNARRHAPGSAAAVTVAYEDGHVTVEITNTCPACVRLHRLLCSGPGGVRPGRRLRPGRDRRAGRLLRRLAQPRPRPGREFHRDRPIAADVTGPLRVLVADDQELVRAGFRLILEAAGFDVVGEAPDGAVALELAALHRPDVVLMDIRMPVLDGIAATRQLTASGPAAPKVVILTTFDLDDYVYEALRAGASGFLLKDAPRADLIAAVRVAAAGDALLAPSVTRRLIEAFAARPAEALPSPSRLASLTPRERDILLLVARGRSNLEIARDLVVSEATVKTHVAHLLAKLGLRDRVQAVILAYETGAVTPGRPN